MHTAAAFLGGLVLGCSNGDPPIAAPDASPPLPACGVGFFGDPAKEPLLEIRILDAMGADKPLADKDEVAMIFPPQGGRVIFVGARATNVDGCGLQLLGAVRDPATKQVRIDARTVNLVPSGDGWGASGTATQTTQAAIASYSNVPLCPNQWSATDVFGHEYELTVTITDRRKRVATKTVRVVPRCAEPANLEECLCLCKQGYVLGESCVSDAGADG
jgi:hypothetical protein